MVKQKWLSILNHIANVHEGHGDKFPRCQHGELEERSWMTKGKTIYIFVVKSRNFVKGYTTWRFSCHRSASTGFCKKCGFNAILNISPAKREWDIGWAVSICLSGVCLELHFKFCWMDCIYHFFRKINWPFEVCTRKKNNENSCLYTMYFFVFKSV